MSHICHWPGCRVEVKPRFWGCRPHWYALPRVHRSAIWRTYVPGQEDRKNPTREYLAAATAAERWARRSEHDKAYDLFDHPCRWTPPLIRHDGPATSRIEAAPYGLYDGARRWTHSKPLPGYEALADPDDAHVGPVASG